MKALDIASIFIDRYGKTLVLTNLTLNKLVYFAQVESLRNDPERPLFTDEIQAWEYGPVEPSVYNKFKKFGRNRIFNAPNHETNQYADRIVDTVVEKYAWMNAFDLVNYAHRAGGAWHNVYDASNVPPSAADDDDDYISHIADLIAADPSRFALMAHTDPNKFLESSTPRD